VFKRGFGGINGILHDHRLLSFPLNLHTNLIRPLTTDLNASNANQLYMDLLHQYPRSEPLGSLASNRSNNHTLAGRHASGAQRTGGKTVDSLPHSEQQAPSSPFGTLMSINLLDASMNAISSQNGAISGAGSSNSADQQKMLQYYSRALLLTILIGVFMFTVNVAIFVALMQRKRKQQLLRQQHKNPYSSGSDATLSQGQIQNSSNCAKSSKDLECDSGHLSSDSHLCDSQYALKAGCESNASVADYQVRRSSYSFAFKLLIRINQLIAFSFVCATEPSRAGEIGE
jgi:hypothetical protein